MNQPGGGAKPMTGTRRDLDPRAGMGRPPGFAAIEVTAHE